ncbi:MAG: hypothetical protein R3249_09985 [Nitriliruptorales bacterium]|nr:hypothetical protein [Nitriliruptorales bacterium]
MTDETRRRLRSLERRLRRQRRALERINPIQHPARYRTLFEEVAAMEARRRSLRGRTDPAS